MGAALKYMELLQDIKVIHNLHTEEKCHGQMCVLHNPTPKEAHAWKPFWRMESNLLEWICPCGVGHYDSDQLEYLIRTVGESNAHASLVHGCCGKHCA